MLNRTVVLLALLLSSQCISDVMGQRPSRVDVPTKGGRVNTGSRRMAYRQTHLPSEQYPILPDGQSSAASIKGVSYEEVPQQAVLAMDHGTSSCSCAHCQPQSYPVAWAKAEYLLWWTRGIDVPALATSSAAGTSQADAGVLGLATTDVLFGDAGLVNESRSGGRYSLGFWLDPCSSLEATYIRLGSENETFSASDSDFPILTRPFFNTQNDANESHLVAFPGVASGSLDIELTTEFQTLEVLVRRKLQSGQNSNVDYLWGYRYADLSDGLRLSESTVLLAPAAQGATIALFDQFDTSNEFHGGELGFVTRWQSNPCLTGELVAKLALGSTTSQVNVTGETTSSVGGTSNIVPGGLLAQASNIGQREKQSFSAIAEFGFNLRRRFTPRVMGTFGYTFLYCSEVARVGDQLDLSINTTQIPPGTLSGEARPSPRLETTSFWAQGLNVGLEVAF